MECGSRAEKRGQKTLRVRRGCSNSPPATKSEEENQGEKTGELSVEKKRESPSRNGQIEKMHSPDVAERQGAFPGKSIKRCAAASGGCQKKSN